jgi:uncharacterized protein
MITQDVIEEVKRRLVEVYKPSKIYLFGSYAWGTPNEDSDLDILIVVDESDERPIKRSFNGYMALSGLGISKDIIVYTSEEFAEDSARETSLFHKIKHQGW